MHLMVQLVMVRIFIIQSDSVFYLYPLIAVMSVITGGIVGVMGHFIKDVIYDLRF